MKCSYHPDRDAVGACVRCGRFVCEDCRTILGDKIYCNSCVDNMLENKPLGGSGGPGVSSPMAGGPIVGRANISSNLVWAILVTIFCCMPFGIPAIVYAARVDPLLKYGDYEGARDASKKAKIWCLVAFLVGIVSNVLMGMYYAVILGEEIETY